MACLPFPNLCPGCSVVHPEVFDDSPCLWMLSLRGSRRELARQARGWLRGKGHRWEPARWGLLCPRCGSSVQVAPSLKGSKGRGPRRRHFAEMRRLFPECDRALVEAVHDH